MHIAGSGRPAAVWRMSLSSSGVGASGSGRPAGAIKAYRGEQQTCGAAGKDRELIFGGHPRHRGLGVFSNANPIPVLPMSDSLDSGLRFFPPQDFRFSMFQNDRDRYKVKGHMLISFR